MDDQDLKARLRAYRPAGPPLALRHRVVAAAVRPGSTTCEWMPAAAAALIALMFYWLAASDRQRLFAQFPTVDPGDAIELNLEAQE